MRESKSKELKKDLEILSQTFERIVDRKDATIKSLAKDLQEADEQFAMALRAHLQNVDGLIGINYRSYSCHIREIEQTVLVHVRVRVTSLFVDDIIIICVPRTCATTYMFAWSCKLWLHIWVYV